MDKCILCHCGSQDGIRLRSFLICPKCEEKIANLDVSNPAYTEFLDKLKIIWREDVPVTP